MYFRKWTLPRVFHLDEKSNMRTLEGSIQLQSFLYYSNMHRCADGCSYWSSNQVNQFPRKQYIQFILEELQHFSSAGIGRYQSKAKNWFFLVSILQDYLLVTAHKLKWWLQLCFCSSSNTHKIVVNIRIKKLFILCSNVDFWEEEKIIFASDAVFWSKNWRGIDSLVTRRRSGLIKKN